MTKIAIPLLLAPALLLACRSNPESSSSASALEQPTEAPRQVEPSDTPQRMPESSDAHGASTAEAAPREEEPAAELADAFPLPDLNAKKGTGETVAPPASPGSLGGVVATKASYPYGIEIPESGLPEKPIVFVSKEAPAWVSEPAAFYEPRREDVILVTGSSRPGMPAKMGENVAGAMARSKLLTAQGGGSTQVTTTEGSGSSSTLVTTEGLLKGSMVIAKWMDPEGAVHVLVR